MDGPPEYDDSPQNQDESSSPELDPLQPFCETPEESSSFLNQEEPSSKHYSSSWDTDHIPSKFIEPDVKISDPITIPGSAPPDYSTSPSKKVQFEVGGGDEDSVSLKSDNRQYAAGATLSPTYYPSGTSPTKPAKIPLHQVNSPLNLLPSIAEENQKKANGRKKIGYHKSPSMIETRRCSIDIPEEKESHGFVQLDVLTGDGDLTTKEWKEVARWIKYEEDLEEGSDRWGKPHIASLSFHSLIKLRKLIERDGIFMLNLEEREMPGIAYRIVEELASKKIIKQDDSPLLMRTLLLKHKHVEDNTWNFALKRNTGSVLSLQSLHDDRNKSRTGTTPTDPSVLIRRNSSLHKVILELTSSTRSMHRTASGNYLKKEMDVESAKPINEMAYPSEEDLKWIQRKEALMRRLLPNGEGEGTIVMVGYTEMLEKATLLFIRLAEPSYMYNVTEIPVVTRFAIILLSPPGYTETNIFEIGRSFGALMSNKNFYELALISRNKKHILSGINEFLNSSIVLPPGDWDNMDVFPLELLQAKSKELRVRKLKKQISFIKSEESMVKEVEKQLIEDATTEVHHDSPLDRTGRLFGGLIQDVKRRMPKYKSDIMDSLNFQCFSTIIFMYFASIGLIITFAGLMGDKTDNLIGLSETMLFSSLAGIFYSLFSAQPLIPMGPTGLLLVFDEVLFNFCDRQNIEALPARAWISIWLLLITIIVTAFEGSILVKWFTRFTQEIFAVLTSLLLILESINNLVTVYKNHPLSLPTNDTRPITLTINSSHYTVVLEETTSAPLYIDETEESTSQPNTALLSTILTLGTFFIAYFLKEFRNSIFLSNRARRLLGDFGVPIAILVMVLMDYSATDTYTKKIKVPTGLQPSDPDSRGWFIHPMGLKETFSMVHAIGSVLPALLLFILIFMSQQICELIVNDKDKKVIKGSGFHLDVLLVALINLVCGLFGAPWLCCATLRSLAHINALTVYSKNNPPGEKPTIVEVKEQRITSLIVSILVGCSVLLSPLLAFTPMAVLIGVFLYMGVSSLSNTQFYERFRLLFIPVKSHPQLPFVRRVKTWKMHAYTIIQIGCLFLLYGVKSWKTISLAFPFFLILLVPIRLQLSKFYTEMELDALDGGGNSRNAKKSR